MKQHKILLNNVQIDRKERASVDVSLMQYHKWVDLSLLSYISKTSQITWSSKCREEFRPQNTCMVVITTTMFLAWGLSLDQDLASVHNASIFADSQPVWMRIQLGVIGPPRPEPFFPFLQPSNPYRHLNMIDFRSRWASCSKRLIRVNAIYFERKRA